MSSILEKAHCDKHALYTGSCLSCIAKELNRGEATHKEIRKNKLISRSCYVTY